VYGPVPPLAVKVVGVNADPTTTDGIVVGAITSAVFAHWFTTSRYERLPWHVFASVAVTVIGYTPSSVGVPDSVAVPVLKFIPAGSAPVMLHVYGAVPTAAVNSVEGYALFTTTLGMKYGYTRGFGFTVTVAVPDIVLTHPVVAFVATTV
jgi:hypothetical protein